MRRMSRSSMPSHATAHAIPRPGTGGACRGCRCRRSDCGRRGRWRGTGARVAVADVVAVVALSRASSATAVTPQVAAVDVAAIPAVAAFQCVAHAPQVAVVDIAAFGAGLGGQAEGWRQAGARE